jgi:hypothetical protein
MSGHWPYVVWPDLPALWAFGMSALPPKADMCGATSDVCFGPIADISRANDVFDAEKMVAQKLSPKANMGGELDVR